MTQGNCPRVSRTPGAGNLYAPLAAAMAPLNSSAIDSKAWLLRSTRLLPTISQGRAVPTASGNGWTASKRVVEGMNIMEFIVPSPVLFRFNVRDR